MDDGSGARRRGESHAKALFSPVVFWSVETAFIAHPIQEDGKTFYPFRPPQATWFRQKAQR